MINSIKFRFTPLVALAAAVTASAQVVNDSSLQVTTIASGLTTPISAVFLGPDDLLVSEKATGKVKRIKSGIPTEVLDLAVNSASERGMLGMVLHPDFPANPSVYIYWSESSTGADTVDAAAIGLRGNRLDRFIWNGSNLVFSNTLWTNRALQTDAGQPVRGNHNGGVIRFGHDKKLYLIIGDTGRRGW
ncbi:MAG: PQQ-dependent sugar dehydrogenase, partial [Chthonomonas sp.]|nr:PQQ-dependent sugar dehydrogenase [Chthonomonas sp.]